MTANRANSMNMLRLAAAMAVLVGHAFVYTGGEPVVVGSMNLETLAVAVFFVLSGYLISQSWLSDSDFKRYFQRRALRIFPALIVVVFIAALLVGPLYTTNTLGEYFSSPGTYLYLLANSVLLTKWRLPGVFEHLPVAGAVNGALWTLPIEFALYCLVPFIVAAWRRSKNAAVLGLVIMGVALRTGLTMQLPIFTAVYRSFHLGWALAVIPYFLLGAALRLSGYSKWPPKFQRVGVLISVAAVAGWIALAGVHPVLDPIAAVPIGLLVVALGESALLHSVRIERLGDLSYGLYLWASLVQQAVIQTVGTSPYTNIAVAMPISLGLAWLSWNFVEKRPLRLKPKQRLSPSEEQSGLEQHPEAIAG